MWIVEMRRLRIKNASQLYVTTSQRKRMAALKTTTRGMNLLRKHYDANVYNTTTPKNILKYQQIKPKFDRLEGKRVSRQTDPCQWTIYKLRVCQ